MNEERKEIIVNGIRYEFWFEERLNMWRTLENNSLVDNCAIDLEIDLAKIGGTIEWKDIADFIDHITGNRQIVNENIKDAQFVLWSYFKLVYKKAFDEDFFNDVVFEPTGIDYKGKNARLNNSFMYDFFFFPEYVKDIYRDIGSVPYTASFRAHLFLGIHCDL